VQRLFYPEGAAPDGTLPCEACVLHPPGGIVTGDSLEVVAECCPGAKALVTSPAADKFYRARTSPGLQRQSFRGVAEGPGAELEHLPQEAIVFSGARALRETVYEVSGGGKLAGWGTVLLGRAAAGESFTGGSYRETLMVFRDGEPALLERTDIRGSGEPWPAGLLSSPLGLMSRPVMSYFLCLGSGDEREEAALAVAVGELRELAAGGEPDGFPEFSGATLRDGIMLARSVGLSVPAAERYCRAAWSLARPALLGREAVFPRIWRT
jgi:urease accessory protein